MNAGLSGKDVTSFWKRIDVEVLSGCWIWQGNVDSHGYAQTSVQGRKRLCHRLMYEHYVEKQPLELHHECAVLRCVNPYHLRPVTRSEHRRMRPDYQRERCKRDHEPNWRITPGGKRVCRTCERHKSAQDERWSFRQRSE